jgi:hypothetical protein
MTTYSRRAFRVDQIEWNATPDFVFTTSDQQVTQNSFTSVHLIISTQTNRETYLNFFSTFLRFGIEIE